MDHDPKQYRIRPGYSFRLPNGDIKTGGDVIELADDVVRANANAVELVVPEPAPAPPVALLDPIA